MGRGARKMRGNVQGIRSINGRFKRDGEVKNNMGNGEAKEFIFMTHGHELKWGHDGWRGLQGRGGSRGEKNGTTVIP